MKLQQIITALLFLLPSSLCMGMDYTHDNLYQENQITCATSLTQKISLQLDEAAWLVGSMRLKSDWENVHGYQYPHTIDNVLKPSKVLQNKNTQFLRDVCPVYNTFSPQRQKFLYDHQIVLMQDYLFKKNHS